MHLDELLKLYTQSHDLELHMISNLTRQYDMMIDYIVDQFRLSLTTLVRRVIDIRDEIRAGYADYKAAVVSEAEFKVALVDAQLELQEILNLRDEIIEDLQFVIDNLEKPDSTTISNIYTIIDKLETALDNYWLNNFSEIEDYLTQLYLIRRLVKDGTITWSYISKKTGSQCNFTGSRPSS